MKILVMDVGGTAIKSALFSDGELSDYRVSESSSNTEKRIAAAAEIALGYSGYDAVGIASTGQINAKDGKLLFRYEKRYEPDHGALPMGEFLNEKIGKPTFILNDCNAAALGEAYNGAGRGVSDFLCLTYGTGVGGAIIQGGRLYEGSIGIAAEMGHMVTHMGGEKCNCGNRGCYERYASTTALVRYAKKVHPEIKNAKEIFEISDNDTRLRRVIRRWEDEIIAGLHTLTYIFNPSCIILGGGVMEQESVICDVRERFKKAVLPTFASVELLPATLGNRAGMYGAAVYAKMCLEGNK